MDVHRCRFVDYEAAPINAIAFSHPHLPSSDKTSRTAPVRMAVGRENGDIEIWNPLAGTWLHESTIKGGRNRSVEALAWTVGHDETLDDAGTNKGRPVVSHGRLRLFSIGFTNTVTEWDLEHGRVKRNASGQHGDLWCLAAQPKPKAGTSAAADGVSTQRLVGGTMDGCLALYSTEDDDLRFQRLCRLPKKNIKVVSLAFQTRQLVVAGCSDGTIRVVDIRNGAVLHSMTIGRDLAGERAFGPGTGAKNVIVWSVKCLANGDIVSGDSTGHVTIWDGTTYTQAQRLQSHTQDVLSLATSADGRSIVSGGMDRRVVLHREVPGQAMRWARVWHRRYHQHDVKTLATFETRTTSVVVAGGPDATPVVLPLDKSGVENHRALSHLPQTVPVASAPAARRMICWWQRQVQIWAFDAPIDALLSDADADADVVERNRRQVGAILLQGDNNIVAADISADGALVVVVTTAAVKAFQLRTLASGAVAVAKIAVPAKLAERGAHAVAIAPSGQWVALASGCDDRVAIAEVVSSADGTLAFRPHVARVARLARSIPRHELFGGLGRYSRRISHLAFAPDSKLLAAADIAGYIDSWVQGGEVDDDSISDSSDSDSDSDSDDSTWVRNPRAKQLPKLPAAPTALTFAPDVPGSPAVAGEPDTAAAPTATDYVLLAITAAHRLYAFHPLQARLVPWSRRFSPAHLPVEYRNIRDVAKGALWQGARVWIYGPTFLFMIDTSVDAPPAPAAHTDDKAAGGSTGSGSGADALRKRKRGDDSGAGNAMKIGAIGPQRVQMAVENEWVDVDMDDADKEHAADDDDDDDETDSEAEAEAGTTGAPAVGKTRRGKGAKQVQAAQRAQPRWWHTFKYRPILGVVPLVSPAAPQLEVALIERPAWDLAMPERYAE